MNEEEKSSTWIITVYRQVGLKVAFDRELTEMEALQAYDDDDGIEDILDEEVYFDDPAIEAEIW